jgi:hypothetical protein
MVSRERECLKFPKVVTRSCEKCARSLQKRFCDRRTSGSRTRAFIEADRATEREAAFAGNLLQLSRGLAGTCSLPGSGAPGRTDRPHDAVGNDARAAGLRRSWLKGNASSWARRRARKPARSPRGACARACAVRGRVVPPEITSGVRRYWTARVNRNNARVTVEVTAGLPGVVEAEWYLSYIEG